MLKLINITKEYRVDEEVVHALKGVSIEFRKNEFVSILGPSGCGKTTLLNIIGGLDRYTSGDITIDKISTKQYDDVDWDTYRNRRIGFVFQSYNLIPHMSILKNVALGLTLAGVERDECKVRAMEALRKVGLEDQARKKPNQLSGGQMQRVAIARALVNNPEIILADEPTGALDSESGVQVMDLLKEVAEDRLVIMVTHNPLLAEEYSTRTVYLNDGQIDGDTMPFTEEDALLEDEERQAAAEASEADAQMSEAPAEAANQNAEADEQNAETVVADGEREAEGSAPAKQKKKKQPGKLAQKLAKLRKSDRSSMKLSTAISLSWTNLLSKKGRTLLTSIAGSIGIIGIILVLALSNGAGLYINSLEENALSTYPITVNESSVDPTSLISMLMTATDEAEKVKDDEVKVQQVLGNVLQEFTNNLDKNDLKALKAYTDANFDKDIALVKYSYGTTFNAYVKDPKNSEREEADKIYMKVNPYTETMNKVIEQMGPMLDSLGSIPFGGQMMPIRDAISQMVRAMGVDAFSEMSDSRKLLESQYELVGGNMSRWPEKENEVVIVVNEHNRLMDFQLFMLGLKSQDDVLDAMTDKSFAEVTYQLEDLLNLRYKVLANTDYLEPVDEGTWQITADARLNQHMDYIDSRAIKFFEGTPNETDEIKVVGVVRPIAGTIASSISGVVGYTSKLTYKIFEHVSQNDAVKAMLEAYDAAAQAGANSYDSVVAIEEFDKTNPVHIGDQIAINENGDGPQHNAFMRRLGYADIDTPAKIEFYCTSFESKDKIVDFFHQFEKDTGNSVKYTDMLSTMMSFVDTMADTITGVLVAFAAISLVVSTIMIAIIIYTSVLERRKEIGVLRSIGARKKDISRVFLAESAILGGYSGVIGILVSTLISLAGSAVLKAVFNIKGLMQVKWWHALVMLAISILLSMLAGFIPSRIAAKKDPAIALRSE